MLNPSFIGCNLASPPPRDESSFYKIHPGTYHLPPDSPKYSATNDRVFSPDNISHHVNSWSSFLTAFLSLFVVLLLFIKRCHLVELPDILDFQSELIMCPDRGFLHCFSQLRDIAVDRKIIRITYNRIDKPIPLSSAYLCLLIDVSQNIAHNIIEQPCRKISANTQMLPRIIAHKSTQEP